MDTDGGRVPVASEPTSWDTLRRPALFALTAVLYAGGSATALAMAEWSGLSAVGFIPAGVTLAILLRTRRTSWWVVLAAAAVTELALDAWFGLAPAAIPGFILANTVEPLVGATIVRLRCGVVDLRRRRDLWWFIAGGVMAGPAIGALIGSLSDWIFTGDDAVRTFLQWWLGDAVGVVLVGGLLLGWGSGPDPRRARSTAGVAHLLAIIVLTAVSFAPVGVPIGFVVLAGVVVAGAAFGVRMVGITGLVVAFTGVAVRALDLGPLVPDVPDDVALLIVKAQIGLYTLAGMVVAAEASERARVSEEAVRMAATAEHERLRAEARLRERELLARSARSERRLRSLVTQTSDGLLDVDRDGRITGASPVAVAVLGLDPDDLAGKHMAEVLGVTALGDGRRDGVTHPDQVVRSESRLTREDGTEVVIEVVAVESDTGSHVVLRDITELRRAVEALATSEARYHTLFASIDEGFCIGEMIVDADDNPIDYRFLATNAHFAPMTGIQDAVGHTARELVPGLEDSWVETYARVALRGEVLRFESHSPAMGRSFDVFATPVEPHGCFALVFKETTDRRAAEAALRESEERFRTLAESAPVIVWQSDEAGACTYLNQRWYEFTGGSTDAGLGAGWLESVHPEDRRAATELFMAAVRDQSGMRCDYRLSTADGDYRWTMDSAHPRFDADGRFLGHVGSVIDIHDRKLMERRMQEDGQRFRDLADHVPHMIWQQDAAGAQVYVNSTFCEYFGVDRDLMSGDRWLDLVHPDDVAGYRAAFREAVESRSSFHGEVRVRRADGEIRWLESWADAAFDRRGDFMGHVGASVDITERKAAEDAIRDFAESERRRRLRSELISQIMADLQTVTGFSKRCERLVQLLVPRIADYATIERPDSDEPLVALAHVDPQAAPVLAELRLRHRISPDLAFSVSRSAAGEEHLISDVSPALRSEFSSDPIVGRLLDRLAPRSHMALPIRFGTGSLGTLMLGLTDATRRPYTEGDLAFVREVADRAGVLLAAAQVTDREHTIAVELQRALLPVAPLEHSGLQIGALYRAAADGMEVGGDWYETFTLPDGRIGIAVGDVVGHGLPAAAAMGRLRSAMGALASLCDGPGELLTELDRFCHDQAACDFATTCIAMFAPDTGALTYASAGHPPMLVVATDGSATWLEDGKSPPLGIGERRHRPEATVTLAPGATLIMFSDGLVERRRSPIDDQLARLAAVTAEHADLTAAELCEAIVAQLTDGEAYEDDVALVCMRTEAMAPPLHLTLPADPAELATLRTAMWTWLASVTTDPRCVSDVLLSVGEAAANAIEHAYSNTTPGHVIVDLAVDGSDAISATIADQGTWRQTVERPERGRGLMIIEQLAEGAEVSTDADGTTVRFSIPIPR